jgi:hypothetical protein
MQNVLWRLQKDERFDVLKLELEHLKQVTDVGHIVRNIAAEIIQDLGLKDVNVHQLDDFSTLFRAGVLSKPLILIMDEFDALMPEAISGIASVLRNIHIKRQNQAFLPTEKRDYLLHGVALIGVRAVLGVENVSGSPFNVQRSVHIPNLTFEEVESMFHWYERESGQRVDEEVIERVFVETRGQPGLVSWFGELLTEKYNAAPGQAIGTDNFVRMLAAATDLLPNNTILNLISKARREPYQQMVLRLFETGARITFKYDDPEINYLYLNGVIDLASDAGAKTYVRFANPFVQKRLFNYFATVLFREMGRLYPPFDDLDDTITDEYLNISHLLRRYESYLQENRHWLLKDAPRRADLRVREAVYHFNLYQYLFRFLQDFGGQVYPEFPTGNGKVDLHISYAGQAYAIEVKSYRNPMNYRDALKQAARYGKQLGLEEITLAFFVEAIDESSRVKYEESHHDEKTGVKVQPVFVVTGR